MIVVGPFSRCKGRKGSGASNYKEDCIIKGPCSLLADIATVGKIDQVKLIFSSFDWLVYYYYYYSYV